MFEMRQEVCWLIYIPRLSPLSASTDPLGCDYPCLRKVITLSCHALYLLREFPLPEKHHRIIPRTVRKNFLANEASSFCPNLCTGTTLWLVFRSPASSSTTDLVSCLPSRGRSALSFTTKDYDTKSARCKRNIFQTDPLTVTVNLANPLAAEAEDVTQSNHGKKAQIAVEGLESSCFTAKFVA